MRKLTTQEFIDRARAVHGDKYGYAFSVYQGNHTKLMIHCPEHGMFEQRPNYHLSGKDCPKCGIESKKHDSESFIKKAIKVHGENYGYAFSVYQSAHEKVMIHCPKHGMFEQSPHSHVQGQGCPDCGGSKKHDNDSFIARAREVHGSGFYDYSLVEYTGNKNKVTIVCTEHGVFEQKPHNHLHGQGCPGCANHGFDRTKSASLYVLRSDCGRYMKIGITNKADQRQAQLSRATPFSFKRIELIEGTGEQIANLEKELLAEYQPAGFTETFDGHTEWVLWDDSIRHKLISFMNKELTNGPI